jgi:cyanocobalamin reductase (cyanide-eliminating) / alkylcobalamin dealkylase
MALRDEVIGTIRDSCRRLGFDLVQPLQVGWYNDAVAAPLRLEDFGSGQHLAVVVGNTRALWPVWCAALATDPALAASADPLDAYTVRALNDIASALSGETRSPRRVSPDVEAVPNAEKPIWSGSTRPSPAQRGQGEPGTDLGHEALCPRVSLRFAHEGGNRRIAVQRLAHAAGLAYLTETHASVHPTYGPWIALRAAMSLDIPGPLGLPPQLEHPCGGCSRGCLPAFERALTTLDGAPSEANLRAHWQTWLAWRDACPVGREHRYTEAQIRYHYLRDPGFGGPAAPNPTDLARG